MPTYLITAPDGRKFRITGDGTQEEALAQIQSQYSAPKQAEPEAPANPTEGGGTLRPFGIDTGIKTPQAVDRFLSGAGRAMDQIGLGARQLLAPIADANAASYAKQRGLQYAGNENQQAAQQAVADSRQTDAPLLATTAGKAGNIAGGIAAAVPASLVPGANTVAGAGLIGGAFGALQPADSAKERAANVGLGAATGAGAQYLGGKISAWAGNKLKARTVAAQSDEAQNAVRDATLKEARKAGYVVPPSAANPTVANRALESVSGKAATSQTAAVRNQKVTNSLVRKELGLSADAPLTKATLNGIRSREGEVYKALKAAGKITVDDAYIDDLAGLAQSVEEVAKDFPDLNIGANQEIDKLVNGLLKDSFDSGSAVEAVKLLRKQASGNLSFAASADPSKKALGLAQRDAAAAVEDMLIRHLESTGKGALASRFDAARQTIAKTYSVEAALNEGSGNVVAANLANQLKRGKPLSGGLATAAKFAQTFGKAAAEIKDSPGVSAVDALIGGVGGMTINPALAGIPLARIGTRQALLTSAGQKLAVPNYAPGKTGTALLEAAKLSKRAAIPSVVYATQQ